MMPLKQIAAAKEAFEQLQAKGMGGRKRAIEQIRRIAFEQQVELGTMEMEETQIGRLEHKIEKLQVLGTLPPGVEFLPLPGVQRRSWSGSH